LLAGWRFAVRSTSNMGMIWELFKHLRNLKKTQQTSAKVTPGRDRRSRTRKSGDDRFEILVRTTRVRGEMMENG
jgi:hypothetical protein